MVDKREGFLWDTEEVYRTLADSFRANLWTAMPVRVGKQSDGKTAQASITIKGQTKDEKGKLSQVQYPVLDDVPIHFLGGGGDDGSKSVVLTHPVTDKDEGLAIFMSRPIDTWFEQGGTQNAQDLRSHHLADAVLIPGVRAKPRELKHIDTAKAQLRSVDKKHVVSHDPSAGTTIRSVKEAQPSQNGQDVDPFEKPKTYYDTSWQGAVSYLTRAVQDQTTHKHQLTYDNGHVIDVNNGAHSATVHPSNGAAISAQNGAHKVEALTSQVKLTSSSKVEAAAPLLTAQQDITAGRDVTATRTMSAALGAFGGLGGSGGGAGSQIPGNLSMGGNITAGGNATAALVATHGFTVAAGPNQLPAASAAYKGFRAFVTDAAASQTWMQAIAGGGSAVFPVFCNGSAWLAA